MRLLFRCGTGWNAEDPRSRERASHHSIGRNLKLVELSVNGCVFGYSRSDHAQCVSVAGGRGAERSIAVPVIFRGLCARELSLSLLFRYLILLLVSQGRWFNRRGRRYRLATAIDEDGQTTRVRDCGFDSADDGHAGRRQMEPLPQSGLTRIALALCSRVRVCLESTSLSRALSRRTSRLVERLRASTRKKRGPALHRPSTSNPRVAGSTPARRTREFFVGTERGLEAVVGWTRETSVQLVKTNWPYPAFSK